MDDCCVPGIGPDGTPYRVRASVDPGRGRGALLGLAVGDALGTTTEFSTPSVSPLPELCAGPHRDMTGQGPFRLEPGQVTDDTQMAACLSESLSLCGMLDLQDLSARYRDWTAHAFDVGGQIASSLSAIAGGIPPTEAGRRVWLRSGRQAAGNGSLMRTAPVGLFFAGQREDLLRAALDESAITHFDPRCRLACAAFDAALAAGARELASPRGMAADAVRALDDSARLLLLDDTGDEAAIRSAHSDLRMDLRLAAAERPELDSEGANLIRHAGFVRVAFRIAFWHLLHTPSFEDALVDVVNRGGDADTNAAVTGALLGAAYGEEAIPEGWRGAVLDSLRGRTDPLATLYHPRTLLRLIREDPWA